MLQKISVIILVLFFMYGFTACSYEGSVQPGEKTEDYVNAENNTSGSTETSNSTENTPPLAVAGNNKGVKKGITVTLNGSDSSDQDGDSLTYTWTLDSKPQDSLTTLANADTATPSLKPDTYGEYIVSLVVHDGKTASEKDSISLRAYGDIDSIEFNIIDAEYSKQLNKIIIVSSNPNTLHIYDPVNKTSSDVLLSAIPLCVSVSPDGLYAVVGYSNTANISHINLSTESIIKTIDVSTEMSDIVLGGNDYAYVLAKSNGWDKIKSVNLLTDAVTTGSDYIHSGTVAKLHPSGNYIYGADNGVSPSDIEKYDISGGVASYLWDSPYHGDYSMCGNLWMSEYGLRIFTRCGNVFKSDASQSFDMTYNGKLSDTSKIKNLVHSASLNKIMLIPDNSYADDADKDVEVQFYTYTSLQYEESITLPFVENNDSFPLHGKYIFAKSDGSNYFVISQADSSSGLLHDFFIVTY